MMALHNNHMLVDPGNLYVIAAPSGTGKTTLVKALVEHLPGIIVSISHTTRPKRPNETDGIHYYFVNDEAFKQLISENYFIEHANIFDHYYGTSRNVVATNLAEGYDVILEIDWQGFQQIKQLFPSAIGIFLLPPSFEALRTRLQKRNQDQGPIIEKRLADAALTLTHVSEFDYVVINDDFTQAQKDLAAIVTANRLLQGRQKAKLARILQKFPLV